MVFCWKEKKVALLFKAYGKLHNMTRKIKIKTNIMKLQATLFNYTPYAGAVIWTSETKERAVGYVVRGRNAVRLVF